MKANSIKNVFLASCLLASSIALAGEREQAKKLYSSLTGNTANKATADHYEQMLKDGKLSEAANEMTEANQGFYNVTLKNFFTPMSNEDGTTFAPLNDMTATLIGATRDEINFFRVFWDDILYQIDGRLITNSAENIPARYNDKRATNDWLYLDDLDAAVPIYNRTKNEMYIIAEEFNLPYGNREYFKRTQQLTYSTKDAAAIAGIFSTRAWAAAYYIAGTNRASFAYFAKNFFGLEMEELSDTTIPDFRVRRDIDRAPGGVAQTYKTFCVGCHAGQDGLGGGFAYYDYVDGAMVYGAHDTEDQLGNPIVVGPVAPKINRNNLFPEGKITSSDSWINLWNQGQNAYIGWGEAQSGNGAKSLGKMLSESTQLRKALSAKAFEAVCFRKPTSVEDKASVTAIANKFDIDGNMKDVFINAAVACMGD